MQLFDRSTKSDKHYSFCEIVILLFNDSSLFKVSLKSFKFYFYKDICILT